MGCSLFELLYDYQKLEHFVYIKGTLLIYVYAVYYGISCFKQLP